MDEMFTNGGEVSIVVAVVVLHKIWHARNKVVTHPKFVWYATSNKFYLGVLHVKTISIFIHLECLVMVP